MHIDVSIGEKIKHRREDKHITQHELAKQLGITPAAVCQWETKGTVPRAKTLAKIAKALGLREDYLSESAASQSVDDEAGSVSAHLEKLKAKVAEAAGIGINRVHVNITITD